MKRKIKLILTIEILVLVLLGSSLNAKNIVNNETNEEPSCIGCIYGCVGNSHGIWAWEPYMFVLVDAEVKQTRTCLKGLYCMFLPLNNEYQVTAYKSGFKPMTKEVNLTDEIPIQEVIFDFFESESVIFNVYHISQEIKIPRVKIISTRLFFQLFERFLFYERLLILI